MTYPPKRARRVRKKSRDKSSEKSQKSQRSENENEDTKSQEDDLLQRDNKKRPNSTKAAMNKNFAFGHKLLCPEDAQNKA